MSDNKELKPFLVPNLTPKKAEPLSPGELKKILTDVIAAFESAGKPIKDITVVDGDREVKMSADFIKNASVN